MRPSLAVPECGEQKTWLVGVNWWMTDYTRVKLKSTQSKIRAAIQLTPPSQRTDGADDHRRRHARTSRLVKLEKRNRQSPPLPDRRPYRGGGSFLRPHQQPADFRDMETSSNRLLPAATRVCQAAEFPSVAIFNPLQTGLHCVPAEVILTQRRYFDAEAYRHCLGLMAALSFGSAPAFAFQETPVPPPRPTRRRKPLRRRLRFSLASRAVLPRRQDEQGGLKLFGYTVLPKLNFGLDVLYGEDQQQLQLQGPTTLDENGDVSVLGKVKRRF